MRIPSGIRLAWLGCAACAAGACDPPASSAEAGMMRVIVRTAGSGDRALSQFVERNGGRQVVPLPIIHGVAVTLPSRALRDLQRLPGVERVDLDRVRFGPAVNAGQPVLEPWNVEATHAPAVWAAGYRGGGVVVANMDTGVDLEHPDLKGAWRGGANGWFDPFDGSAAPFDSNGHGTQTMGIMLEVAPGATWIAARIYDANGLTTSSVIHQAFQWMLDPDGDPATDDAPRVVNASWGEATAGVCDDEFEADIQALRSAGILVVFAAGNSGPSASSSVSPADNAGAFSSGAIDQFDEIAPFSSRGPAACTGAVFPDLVAPGVNVRTTDVSFAGQAQYITVSGTSYAAPHVAGVAALLAGLRPPPTVDTLEAALRSSARDLGAPGPDAVYGEGALDASAALQALTGGAR